MPSFIHTGDIHLGKGFANLGPVGRMIRQAQGETLKRIVEMVRGTNSDFLIIAGDLFDSNSVSEKMVRTVLDSLETLAPTPVFILPGTHDVLDSSSVYRSSLFVKAPENIKVFSGGPCEFRPTKEVAVFGSANTAKRGGQRPFAALASLAEKSDAKYKVAVVHGSLVTGIIDPSSDEILIDPSEVANGPFDYVAAGHWHSRREWLLGAAKVCYAGCPETLSFDDSPSPGTVTLVTLGNQVTLEEKPVGKHRWVKMAVDLGLASEAEVGRKVKAQGSATGLLRLELVGTPDSPVDPESLEEEIAPGFLYMDIDTSRLASNTPLSSDLPENSVMRAFVETMNEKIERATDPDERDVLQEALRRGCLYLSGKVAMRS